MTKYFERLRNAQASLSGSGVLEAERLKNYEVSSGIYRINGGDTMVGVARQMRIVFYLLNLYAQDTGNVLILGESGTGKELAAKSLHYNGPRYNPRVDNFVVINCSSIPESLIESELFGYTRGAFTGASITGRLGAFQRAAGGTIVLDEIADMPFHLQPRLLRVVEDKKIKKVGSDDYVNMSNTKIVASTNQDLVSLVRAGKFRHDLLQRLSVLPLYLPTLLERGELEIISLVNFFASGGIEPSDAVSSETISTILRLNLPGNVRTLENLIKQAKVLGKGMVSRDSIMQAVPYIEAQDAASPFSYEAAYAQETVTRHSSETAQNLLDNGNMNNFPNTLNLEALETWAISQAMLKSSGNKSLARKLLGVTGRVLDYSIDKRKAKIVEE